MMDYKNSMKNKELTELEDTLRVLYSEALATKDSRIEDIFDRMLKYKIGLRSMMKKEIFMSYQVWGKWNAPDGKTGEFLITDIDVSNYGNVRGKLWDNKPFSQDMIFNDKSGHRCIGSHHNQIYLLVDKLFNGTKPKGTTIHHIDKEKTNDRLDNLFRCKVGEHTFIHNMLGDTKMSKESANRVRDRVSNSMWITDGITCKRINKNEEIPQGWKQGRIIKYRRKSKAKRVLNA